VKSLRDFYGNFLVELGEKYINMVVLDADVSSSTKSGEFGKHFPERFFNLGIAEQNLIGVASGLALGGKVPFVNAFSCFLIERAFNQIRQSIAYPSLNVKLCGSHAGLSSYEDGASHQIFIDINLIRSLPNFLIIAPVDDIELEQAMYLLADYNGPCYLRLGKLPVPTINKIGYVFNLNEPVILREGKDITILSYGTMVSKALEAADELNNMGISTNIVNVHTLKPLSKDLIDICFSTKHVITIEEHSVIGGLGGSLSEMLAPFQEIRHKILGIPDVFGMSGSPEKLFAHFGLTKENIINQSKSLLSY
jgi:transketolase